MKKCFLRGIAIAAIAGFVLTLQAQDSTDQSQYPTILSQPVDQCVPVGSPVTFSVTASNVDSYQWYKNNTLMEGQTNSSLTIASAAISDVSYYSAAVMKGNDAVPTRMAILNVYTTSSGSLNLTTSLTTKSRLGLSLSLSGTLSAMDLGGGGTMTMYGMPVTMTGGNSNNCPGRYSGYVNFTKTASQGWGWAPTAGAPSHTATDYNRSDTKVYFMGSYSDSGCGTNSVNVSNPTSPVYRFSIFFPIGTQVPTNTYAITLDGFDP
jgi:hypothetical protein